MSDATACRIHHLDTLLVGKVPLYAYEFDDRTAPWYFPPLSFPHGAAHTIDIQFLFKDWHGGPLGIPHALDPAEEHLSHQLVDAWTSLMATGNPDLIGNAPWPEYTRSRHVYLSENVPKLSAHTEAAFTAAHQCAFWDGILIY